MTDHVYKIIEVVGSSTSAIEEAIENAIAKASHSLHHLEWFEVTETRGHIVDGKVDHYQVVMKVGFRLDD